jgi:hypothetical protein
MEFQNILAMLISIAGLALIYYACYHILGMPKRISAVITFTFTVITYLFLLENPQVLYDTYAKIALAIIASIVGFAYLVRRIL